jgi:hypothetical protein
MLLPISVNFNTDGISSMAIYQAFTINEELLPYSYKYGMGQTETRKVGFIITGLEHTIQNNTWTTDVKANMYYVKRKGDYKQKVGKQDKAEKWKDIPSALIQNESNVSGRQCADSTNRTGKWKSLRLVTYQKTTVNESEVIKYLKDTIKNESIRRSAYAIFAIESAHGNKGVNNNYIGLQTDGAGFIDSDTNYVNGTTSIIDSGGSCRAFGTYETWQRCIDHLAAIMESRRQGSTSKRQLVPINPNDVDYFGNSYAKNWVGAQGQKLISATELGKQVYESAIKRV